MIKLNKMEQNEYNAFIVAVVPSLLPGTYHFRDFFTNRVTSARIGRKFYEDVVNGIYPHSLAHQEMKQAHHSTRESNPYQDQ